MRTRLNAIVLAAIMCVGLLSGCQSSELHSYSADAQENGSGESSSTAGAKMDYSQCYASYDPDQIMMTVNGTDIKWSELFYWYVSEVNNINSSGGITDWDGSCTADSEKTNREYVMDGALEMIKNYCALENKAKEMGVTLTQDDEKQLQSMWDSNVKSYGNGDEEAFVSYLQTQEYSSKDLYDKINRINMLYDRMKTTMFGENGEKINQSEIIGKAADMGYIRVKHIFISSKDDTNETLPDDKLAQKKATADSLLSELKQITDTAQLQKRFDELVSQYGEDPGTKYYPDGYTFVPGRGTMDSAFENAASGLNEYGLSDVVQSAYGYHIILRLPLSTTATVEYSDDDAKTTLGAYVAQEMFGAETDSWAGDCSVKFTDAYNNMNIADVFSKATKASDSE